IALEVVDVLLSRPVATLLLQRRREGRVRHEVLRDRELHRVVGHARREHAPWHALAFGANRAVPLLPGLFERGEATHPRPDAAYPQLRRFHAARCPPRWLAGESARRGTRRRIRGPFERVKRRLAALACGLAAGTTPTDIGPQRMTSLQPCR